MKAYKGFNKDMTCRGFKYEEGKSFETDEAKMCKTGFHACENPIDCLGYYYPNKSVYHEVELDDVSDEREGDSKVVAKKIKIGARLDIAGLCKAAFEYVKSHCTNEHNAEPGKPATAGENGAATAGERGAATAGENGAATAGYRGAAIADNYGAATAGNYGAATAGNYGAATAGNCGAATAGENGAATAGNCGAATAGNYGAATAGNCGAATAGERGAATSRGSSAAGKNGLSVARGSNVRVKGGIGAILVIAEEGGDYNIKDWKAVVVDGQTVKADTWYKLSNGKLVEQKED